MSVKSVDMLYGLLVSTRPEPTTEVRQTRFPYATEWVPAGCVTSRAYPKTATLFQCPECLRAQSYWYETHPKRK